MSDNHGCALIWKFGRGRMSLDHYRSTNLWAYRAWRLINDLTDMTCNSKLHAPSRSTSQNLPLKPQDSNLHAQASNLIIDPQGANLCDPETQKPYKTLSASHRVWTYATWEIYTLKQALIKPKGLNLCHPVVPCITRNPQSARVHPQWH